MAGSADLQSGATSQRIKVTNFDGGAAAELESLFAGDLKRVVLPDLKDVDEAALRRAHAHVMRQVFDTSGIERMAIGVSVLDPLEQEMKRRGMQADYWSSEHRLRSDLALVERQRRDCDAAEQPDWAARLENEAQQIQDELQALRGDRKCRGQ